MRAGLERTLPPDAHILCTGKLFISMTRARDYKNVIVSEYDTREELIQVKHNISISSALKPLN
jgi:hypothetical protein